LLTLAVEGAGAVAKKAAEVLTLDDENDPSKVVLTTTGSEALDPNSTNQVLTVGDDTKRCLVMGLKLLLAMKL
jgi:threonine synthase